MVDKILNYKILVLNLKNENVWILFYSYVID